MSDDNATTATDDAPTTPPEGAAPVEDGGDPTGFDALPEETKKEIKRLRAENGRFRSRNKELEPLAEAAAAAEEANKSEAEKAATRAAAAEERAAAAERKLLAREVADAKSLTAEQAAFLTGTTVEELEASADALIAAFGAGQSDESDEAEQPGSTTPRPALKPTSTAKPPVTEKKTWQQVVDEVRAGQRRI